MRFRQAPCGMLRESLLLRIRKTGERLLQEIRQEKLITKFYIFMNKASSFEQGVPFYLNRLSK